MVNKINSLKEWMEVNKLCIHHIQKNKEFVVDYIRSNTESKKRQILISILLRCTTNLTSVCILTKFMVTHMKPSLLKLSVGLLLRNCYMDTLLGLYLCDKDDCNVHEIAEVLNLKYVKALFDQFEVYHDKFDDGRYDDYFLEHAYTMAIEDSYLHYLDDNIDSVDVTPGNERYLWKAISEKKIRTLIPEEKVKKELNLKEIFDYLKNDARFADCSNYLYAYYKYFSQYEHFSEAGNGNTIVSSSDDNVNMVKAIERLLESIELIKNYGLLCADSSV